MQWHPQIDGKSMGLLHYPDQHLEFQKDWGCKNEAPSSTWSSPPPPCTPLLPPGSPLLSPSHFRPSFCARTVFPDSHVCTYIWRTFIASLKRSIWLVSGGAGKERNGEGFFASLPPTKSVLRDHLNSSAALRPKDGKSSKRFSLMCHCSKWSSYLSIYLEQREGHPKSTCPHFSWKRWRCEWKTRTYTRSSYTCVVLRAGVGWEEGRHGGEDAFSACI